MIRIPTNLKLRSVYDSAAATMEAYLVPIGLNYRFVGVMKMFVVPEAENAANRSEEGTPLLWSNGQVEPMGGVYHTHRHKIVAEFCQADVCPPIMYDNKFPLW